MIKSTKNALNEEKGGFSLWAQNLLQELNERSQEIIKKRFGISDDKPETLEKIGQDYKITRERVRQIIVDSSKKITKNKDNPNFKKAEKKIVCMIEDNSGIISEEDLIEFLSSENLAEANAVNFFGILSEKILMAEEKGWLRKSWILSKSVLDRVKCVEDIVSEIFKKEKKLLTQSEIVKKVLVADKSFSDKEVADYMSVLENIKANKFGRWGVANWKEVTPKGTQDRIHIVLKEKNVPLHFTEIALLIDKYNLGKRKSHPQTVHNELIKDERFVLIGRGTYALAEWGYKKGTVSDVLMGILGDSESPLHREDILKKVMEMRKVKKSTVMINLNNSGYFIKEDEHYSLKSK